MKYKFISIMLIVSVYATQENDEILLENTREQDENGYNFRYSTSDGQAREEIGRIEKVGENLILRISGSYSYMSSDGNEFKVVYEADEGGYKPTIHFKQSQRSSKINERSKEYQDSHMTDKPSTDKPLTTVAGQGTLITDSSLGPVSNMTDNMEVFNISISRPEIALQIGSAAIASLAGGGLG